METERVDLSGDRIVRESELKLEHVGNSGKTLAKKVNMHFRSRAKMSRGGVLIAERMCAAAAVAAFGYGDGPPYPIRRGALF